MSFTVETKSSPAYFPRHVGSTVLADDRLTLVYHKYKTTEIIPKDAVKFNLIFAHGTGMNKSVWTFIIKNLYQLSQASTGKNKWYLDSCISFDNVSHGDSALANKGKLGWVYRWDEGGKDLLRLLNYENDTTDDFKNNLTSRNIAIGHSLGGHFVVLAGFYDPNILDSVVPIEAVLYSDENSTKRFRKLFAKIASLLIDTFDSKEDIVEYFTKFSFYKKMHPEALKDFMEDEIITVIEDGEIKYKTKASKEAQMSSYICSALSVPQQMKLLPLMRLPVCHVIGSNGNWNPPQSIPFVREAIPKRYLSATYDIPKGEHLVHAEQPEDTIKILQEFILKRQADFENEKPDEYAEFKYGKDRNKILGIEYGHMLAGELSEVTGFKGSFDTKL
ncbi:Alpha/Beta hydrolase protein [Scheffersomyces coipomensis]|uniref:Alpha/Beta hydrolase protein n=1 Tax=Scheffersomyces coipomensis TaxID=1788519 RepID=UPI00315D67CA